LLGLTDLLEQIGRYVPSYLPQHRFIHFAFRGSDHRLMRFRGREILRL